MSFFNTLIIGLEPKFLFEASHKQNGHRSTSTEKPGSLAGVSVHRCRLIGQENYEFKPDVSLKAGVLPATEIV